MSRPSTTSAASGSAGSDDGAAFLGIELEGDGRWRLPVTASVCGGLGQLFGGCALGAALLGAERATQRPTAWATCQFLASTFPPQIIEFRLERQTAGRNLTHAQIVGAVDGRDVVVVIGTFGARDFPDEGLWTPAPAVPPPQDCQRTTFDPGPGRLLERVEVREVPSAHPATVSGRTYWWVRFDDAEAASPAALAIAVDFVPLALSAALDRPVFGASLDNTLRIVQRLSTPWVLVEMQVASVQAGLAHATATVWSLDGGLVALGSQTAALSER